MSTQIVNRQNHILFWDKEKNVRIRAILFRRELTITEPYNFVFFCFMWLMQSVRSFKIGFVSVNQIFNGCTYNLVQFRMILKLEMENWNLYKLVQHEIRSKDVNQTARVCQYHWPCVKLVLWSQMVEGCDTSRSSNEFHSLCFCRLLAYINGHRQWKMSEVGLYSTQFGIQSQTLQGEHIFVFIPFNYCIIY